MPRYLMPLLCTLVLVGGCMEGQKPSPLKRVTATGAAKQAEVRTAEPGDKAPEKPAAPEPDKP